MGNIWDEIWFTPAVALVIGFPLVSILLGEAIARLKRKESTLVEPLRLIRNWAVPSLVAYLFLRYVWDQPADQATVMIAATLFYLFSLSAVLGIANAILFGAAATDTWRARVPALFLDLSRLVLVLIGTSIVLQQVWGQDLTKLLTALGVGSIVIGLALQETLGNVFAGVSILFEKPYVEGDWIRYESHLGRVVEINWRSTRLETHFGDTVVVPNGEIARSVVLNENNRTKPHYETFDIGFAYDHPPNEVKQILIETVSRTDGVLADPPPQVYVLGYGDSSINYQIRFAVYDMATLPAIRDSFVTRIWYAAKRHELNIPFPIRTVFHYNGSVTDTLKTQSESAMGLGALKRVLPMESSEQNQDVRVKRFGAGELIIRKGQDVDELHYIVAGRIGIRRESHLPPVQLGVGEIFAVQAVLRDEPSPHDVQALEDTMVVQLGRETVMEMVATKPGFAFELEQIIENRLNQRV